MSANPTRPGTETQPLDDETRATLTERLKTIDKDYKKAESWPRTKERILQNLKHVTPR